MANLFNAKLDVNPLRAALTSLKKDAKKELDNQLKESAENIAARARSLSTVPSISSSIQVSKEGKGYKVTAGNGLIKAELAAYYEFGTGDFARATVAGVPQDWQDYAMTFFINGEGRLPASPYLYPSFYVEITKYINMKTLQSGR